MSSETPKSVGSPSSKAPKGKLWTKLTKGSALPDKS